MTLKNFRRILESELKKENDFVDPESGDINYIKVKDSADKLDQKLIALLADNEELKSKFFTKIKDVYVFNIQDFKFFLDENKVDNSYTKYENKIGLSSGGTLLNTVDDVVLDFPFKDCVLEGGQSTEEGKDTYFEHSDKAGKYEEKTAKRKEVFFNQVLAHDEIDRLFDRKALVNWKRFTKDSGKDGGAVKEIKRGADGTIKENLIIKGNNLLALHSLKSEFAGMVKLIYIDPPYNTGNDGFKYNDNFNHSTWLTFMKNRLEIAKELLRDDGIIFISCDHNEQSYLKVLIDSNKEDLFGRENYIATLSVENNPKGRKNSNYVSISNEFCLIYAKNIKNPKSFFRENLPKDKDSLKHDENGNAYTSGKRVLVGESTNSLIKDFSSKKHYSVYYNQEINEVKIKIENKTDEIDEKLIREGYKRYASIKNNNFIENTYTQDEFMRLYDDNSLIFKDKTIYEKDLNQFIRIKSLLTNDKLNNIDLKTETASKDLDEFGLEFSNPKNISFMKLLLSLSQNKDDIILDYHAGSGTTGHAVLNLNEEDKGNRKFILIEQMDYIKTVTAPRIKEVLKRSKSKDDFIYFELAKWNEKAKEEIQNAKDLPALVKLFDTLYERYFLNYNVKIKDFKEKIVKEEEFKKISLDEQKKMFLKMLDLNQMYVNESEMADKKYGISSEDQKLTKAFYKES
ncbi:site-specific DNA-methyltransferase [Candidatus Saccharibacteria bacterium]|nr:site-specific DNA-methyltransferase [Candidatus Saccharibacteria bacterium]